MKCNNCKKDIIDESSFCPYCGKKIVVKEKEKNLSKKVFIIAIIVIILLIFSIAIVYMKNIRNKPILPSTANENVNLFDDYFSDVSWVKENLYLKTNCLGDEIKEGTEQSIKIAQYNLENEHLCFAIVDEKKSETRECKILKYNNGNVSVETLKDSGNRYDSFVLDTEKKVLYDYHQNNGNYSYKIYRIDDGDIKKVNEISCSDNGVDDNGNLLFSDFTCDGNRITEKEYNTIKNEYINENLEEEDMFKKNDLLEQTQKIIKSEIPESQKAKVTFVDTENNQPSIEEKRVDRESIMDYFNSLKNQVNYAASIDLYNPIDEKGTLYYIEYISDQNEKQGLYGAVLYAHLIKGGWSKTYYKTFGGLWDETNQTFGKYSVLYNSNPTTTPFIDYSTMNTITALDTMKKRILSDLQNYYSSLYSNVRIGFINSENNSWITEMDNEENATDGVD